MPALQPLLPTCPRMCSRWALPAPPGRALVLLAVQPPLSGYWLLRTRSSSWSVLTVVRRGQTASPVAVPGAWPSLRLWARAPAGHFLVPAFSGPRQLGCPAASVVWRQLAWGGASLSCSGVAEGKTRRGSTDPAQSPHTGVWRWCPWSCSSGRRAVWPGAPGDRARPRPPFSHGCSGDKAS